ncbi:MAG TPA: hypothetical protein ENI06_07940 [Spirochaetales bacterium]|nr:hypothetical protein [Spirochaetales bacterium]
MLSEEKLKILQMIQEGHITAEEGAKLIEALETSGDEYAQATIKSRGRTIRIRVTDKESGNTRVNLTLPFGVARFAQSFIPHAEKSRLKDQGIDLDSLFSDLSDQADGKILEVEDEHSNQKIEIWIE